MTGCRSAGWLCGLRARLPEFFSPALMEMRRRPLSDISSRDGSGCSFAWMSSTPRMRAWWRPASNSSRNHARKIMAGSLCFSTSPGIGGTSSDPQPLLRDLMLRHLLSILLLPFVVVVMVPCWILTAGSESDTRWMRESSLAWLPRVTGVLLLVAGFSLFAWCVALFARVGKGTLAPWDPTRRLVAVGPYLYTRNPMISGVAAMLAGEALLWGSLLLAGWLAVFVTVNHIYFVLSEEPGLTRRFGESYDIYKARVPRWLPRMTAWKDV